MARAIDVVRHIAPRALPAYLAAFEQGNALLRSHGITTPLRLAHFLAQVLHESGGLTIQRENLSYRTPARLMEIFGQGRHSAGVAWDEVPGLLGNPQALAERVYGLGNPAKGRELGNAQKGDGYRYRGGGILQTTGRGNYRRMGEKCGVDFEADPELVLSAEHALKPALAEWSEGNLNAAADRDDILTITKKINGGTNGLADRRAWLAKLKPLITSVEFATTPLPDPPPQGGRGKEPAAAGLSRSAAPSNPPPRAGEEGERSEQGGGDAASPAPAVSAADLAQRIVAAMERKGHVLDRGPGEVNIVYVEGLNPDGTANDDADNEWNDLRLVIGFDAYHKPRIVGAWAATTEPGRYYVDHPVNSAGAARIAFGQYRAWQVGMHRGDHEALVQTGGTVTVCRDRNKDGMRPGDVRETGFFGINQHWGYDLARVDKASAGCLVGRTKAGHREFMAAVKTDPRYRADPAFVFRTAILAEADVLALPAALQAAAPKGAQPPSAAPAQPARAPARTGAAIAVGGAAAAAAGSVVAGQADPAAWGWGTWLFIGLGVAGAVALAIAVLWFRRNGGWAAARAAIGKTIGKAIGKFIGKGERS